MTDTDLQSIEPRTAAPALGQSRPWRTAGRTIAAAVEAVAPDFPRLDAATRRVVLTDVAAFTASQVDAMPEHLRYLYRLALIAFEWLAVLRFGRPFTALDGDRRRTWVDFWTESPLAASRNFVKLIRSCTLLAFYDHPAVRDPLERQASRTTGSTVAIP
ncbi:MAG: hypothetical protein B6D46_02970 [Polyangiaceae bacterium UTPRO1]|nr:hypothetical protein [Myxococcales bacterium]OQY68623.1 MAG: hypothetical protein B6D46_02970 [Polyangiaceae bacterium UTPRO1]